MKVRVTTCFNGVTVGGGLEKLSQGRNFFFLIPAPTQLSAYANHEFKIIPTPAQLSAYANHELKKQQERSIEAVHMHSLSETSRKQHNHRSCIYHESTLQQDERRFFYICLAYAQNM